MCISQDSFYRDLNNEDLALAHKSEYNFDHPRTIDDEAILELLTDLSSGKHGRVPEYDFKVSPRQGCKSGNIFFNPDFFNPKFF